MTDISQFRGISRFGRAYEAMLESDTHAPGSVDRVLAERMIRLCPETAVYLYEAYTPTRVGYEKGSCPHLERCAAEATTGCASPQDRVAGIARFCAAMGERASRDLDEMRAGGTEEEIIRRGSDWCTDVARVACALCQVAGIPARLVMLFDTGRAYSGHMIIEAYRGGVWGAVDATACVVYSDPTGAPATTWQLMNHASWIEEHALRNPSPYTRPDQFRGAALSNYFVRQRDRYDYTVSGVNDYCRSILEMSEKGWPGGLRWLHGEDGA